MKGYKHVGLSKQQTLSRCKDADRYRHSRDWKRTASGGRPLSAPHTAGRPKGTAASNRGDVV